MLFDRLLVSHRFCSTLQLSGSVTAQRFSLAQSSPGHMNLLSLSFASHRRSWCWSLHPTGPTPACICVWTQSHPYTWVCLYVMFSRHYMPFVCSTNRSSHPFSAVTALHISSRSVVPVTVNVTLNEVWWSSCVVFCFMFRSCSSRLISCPSLSSWTCLLHVLLPVLGVRRVIVYLISLSVISYSRCAYWCSCRRRCCFSPCWFCVPPASFIISELLISLFLNQPKAAMPEMAAGFFVLLVRKDQPSS